MTKDEFEALLRHAETCVRDDFYFEVTGEDRDVVLKALKAYAQTFEPGVCPGCNRKGEIHAPWCTVKSGDSREG